MQILARPTRTQPATRAGPNAYRAEPQQLRTQDSTVSIGTDGANPAALQMEPMLSAIAQHGSLPPSRIGSPGPAVASTQHQFPSALYPAAASAGPTSFTCMTGVIRATVTPGSTQQEARDQITSALRPLLSSYAHDFAGSLVQAHITCMLDATAHMASIAVGVPISVATTSAASPTATLTVEFEAMMLMGNQDAVPLGHPQHGRDPTSPDSGPPPPMSSAATDISTSSVSAPAFAASSAGTAQMAAASGSQACKAGGEASLATTSALLATSSPSEQREQVLSELGMQSRAVSEPVDASFNTTPDEPVPSTHRLAYAVAPVPPGPAILTPVQEAPAARPTVASLRSHLISNLPRLAPNACVLVCSVHLAGASGNPPLSPRTRPVLGAQRPGSHMMTTQQHTPVHRPVVKRATFPISGLASPPAVQPGKRQPSPPATPSPPPASPPPPPPVTSPIPEGSEEEEENVICTAQSAPEAVAGSELTEMFSVQSTGTAFEAPTNPGSLPTPSLVLPPSTDAGWAGVMHPAQAAARPAPSQAFFLHPPAVVVAPAAPAATLLPGFPASPTATTAGQQLAGVVEDVILYADSQALQEEVQEALAGAGLPTGLPEQVTQLKVLLIEAHSGCMLGSQQVPLTQLEEGVRLIAPVLTSPGLLKYLVLAVVPSAPPPGALLAQPGDQHDHHVVLAALPLLMLPKQAAEEVKWLSRAMVREEAEQFGMSVPAGFVADTPYTFDLSSRFTSPAPAPIHAEEAAHAEAYSPGLLPQEQESLTSEEAHLLLGTAHTVPILRGSAHNTSETAAGQMPAGVWVQRQSVPLHSVSGAQAAAEMPGRDAPHAEGTASQMRHRQVWGSAWPATGLQRVQEEGAAGGLEQQAQGSEHQAGTSAGAPSSGGRRHRTVFAAAMRELMVVTRASVDSSRASGSRPTSFEHASMRSSGESASAPTGFGRASLEGAFHMTPGVPPPTPPSASLTDPSHPRAPIAGVSMQTAGSDPPIAGPPSSSSLPGATPGATSAPPDADWLRALPASLLAFVFNQHLALFSLDMGMALHPPPAVLPSAVAAAEAEAQAVGGVGATPGTAGLHEVAGEGGSHSTDVEDLPGAGGVIPAELQPESEEARAALVAVAKGLMLFLAQHSMLACFQEVAHVLTSPSTGPLLTLQLGERSMSVQEAVELLESALEDPAAVQEVLTGMTGAGPVSSPAAPAPQGPVLVGEASGGFGSAGGIGGADLQQQEGTSSAAAEVAGAGVTWYLRWVMQTLKALVRQICCIIAAVARALLGHSF